MSRTRGRILSQTRPAGTSAASVYSPAASANITLILICNTTASVATFRIFLDDDGTTYDQTTALFYDMALGANTTTEINGDWWMTTASSNLAVASGTGSALTFTVFGEETQP